MSTTKDSSSLCSLTHCRVQDQGQRLRFFSHRPFFSLLIKCSYPLSISIYFPHSSVVKCLDFSGFFYLICVLLRNAKQAPKHTQKQPMEKHGTQQGLWLRSASLKPGTSLVKLKADFSWQSQRCSQRD